MATLKQKELGKAKAHKLAKSHPGMTLSSWLDLNYTHVTLSTNVTEGGQRLVCKQHNVELTIALLSTSTVAEWARVAMHWAPAGTIIDKIPLIYWENKVLLLRQLLAKELLLNPDNKTAKRYLEILERRDAERWAPKQKSVSIKATAAETNGDSEQSNKTLKLEFEVV